MSRWRPDSDSVLTTLLALCAGIASLSMAVVLVAVAPPEDPTVAVLHFAALVFAPLVHALLEERHRRLAWVGWALQIALVVTMAPAARGVGLWVLGFGHLYFRSTRDLEAALCAASAPVAAVVGLALAPAAGLLPLLLVSLVAASAAAPLLHGRWTQRQARRRVGAPRALGRGLLGPVFAGALLLLMLPLLAGIEGARRALAQRAGAAEEAAAARPAAEAPAQDEGASEGDARGGAPGASSESIDFSDELGASVTSDAEVIRVRRVAPARAAAEGEVLYLRDLVLDRFGPEGVTAGDRTPPRARRDGDDGLRDGWVTLAAPLPGMEVQRFAFEARPLRLQRRRWTLLFAPRPLLAVDIEPVRAAADGPSVVDGLFASWFAYEALVGVERPTRRELETCASRAAPRYLQLPAEGFALERLADLSRDLTRGAETDLDRVVAVIRHLRGLDYALEETSFPGTAALAEFIERGRGYCTHFASTAALLLRLSGVPARVAVGYLAREPDDEGGWVVRDRDAHAWIEVPFEGHGWLVFDPTPAGERGGGAARGWSPLADEPELAGRLDWWRRARLELERWADGDGDLLSALATLSRGAARWTLSWPLAALAAGAAGLALARRGARRVGVARAERRELAARDLHGALSALLAGAGLRRPPGVPLEAHAQRLVARGAGGVDLLPELVRLAYRERFGPGLGSAETQRAEGLVAQLADALGQVTP